MNNPICCCGHRYEDHDQTKKEINKATGKCKDCYCHHFKLSDDQTPLLEEMDPLTIEYHFNFFLKRNKINRRELTAHELNTLQDTFYSGATSMLISYTEARDTNTITSTIRQHVIELQNYWIIDNLKDTLKIN